MPKLNIPLGEKWGEVVEMPEKSAMHYPELHITSDEKIDLPHEGTMTIRYKKVGYREHGDRYTCDIEVHEIVSAYGEEMPEPPSKRDKSAEEALDALLREKMSKTSKSDENY